MLPTLDPKSDLETLYEDILFTLVRLRAYPFTQGYAESFQTLETEWWTVAKQEKTLLAEKFSALLSVETTDEKLDGISDETASVTLLETKNNRRDPLFVRYFGSQAPSVFKRPILAGQFKEMRTWVPSLLASSNPGLQACGAKLEALIPEAMAVQARSLQAEQQIEDFRTSGERKQFFDQCNAQRKLLHGQLEQMVYEQPSLRLPRTFANTFFRHSVARRSPTVAELESKIAAAEAETARLKELRDRRLDQELTEENAKLEAKRELSQARLQAAAREAEEAAARLANLKAEFDSP